MYSYISIVRCWKKYTKKGGKNIIFLNFRLICVFIVTILAVIDDYKNYKISNRIILLGIFLGLSLGIIESSVEIANISIGGGELSNIKMEMSMYLLAIYKGLISYMLSGILILFLTLGLYTCKALRAGDIKLFFVIGMCLGFNEGLHICIWSLAGSVLLGFVEILCKKSRLVGEISLGNINIKLHGIHYSYGILFALIVSLLRLCVS